MLYLDTSALLKLYMVETGSSWVQQQVVSQDDPLPIWELQEAELMNALHLKVFWGEYSPEEVASQIDHFQSRKKRGMYQFPYLDRSALMDRFRVLSELSMKLGTRTLDVLHVACACELKADGFLTFDSRQTELAEKAGLQIHYPPQTS
ncbi:MAG: type II toxin-antitoxin system VapC family toxin [Kiritimatiellia bacterium]